MSTSGSTVVGKGECRKCGVHLPFSELVDYDTPFGFSVYLCAPCFEVVG